MQPDLQHGVKANSELVLPVRPHLYPELRNMNAIVGMFRVLVYTNEDCGDWRRTEEGAKTNGETPELPGR